MSEQSEYATISITIVSFAALFLNDTNLPQYEIEKLARYFLPDILAFYEREEGQREFAAWQAQREQERHLQDTKAQ